MPLLRCRHYDDNGNPIGSGCPRGGTRCEFSHPSEPSWNSAGRKIPFVRDSGPSTSVAPSGHGRRRGWEASHTGPPPSSTQSASWKIPPLTSYKPATDKSTSSWPSKSTRTWETPINPPTQDEATSRNLNPSTSSSSSGGWDAPVTGSGNWGDDETESPGGGWGGFVTGKSWEAPRKEEDVYQATKAPKSPKSQARPSQTSHINTQGAPNQLTKSAIASIPPSHATSVAGTNSSIHNDEGSQADEKRCKEKSHSAKETIRLLIRAVRLDNNLKKAEEKLMRWKETQRSSQYAHMGPAGLRKLEDIRIMLDREVHSLKKEQSSTLSKLIECDLTSELGSGTGFGFTEAGLSEITRYTEEVKTWIEDVRPFLIHITTPPAPPPNHSSHEREADRDGLRLSKRRRLSEGSSVEDERILRLRALLSSMDERIDELALKLEEEMTASRYTNLLSDAIDEQIQAHPAFQSSPTEDGQVKKDSEAFLAYQGHIEEYQGAVDEQLACAAELKSSISARGVESAERATEIKQMRDFIKILREEYAESERIIALSREEVRELSEQTRSLLTRSPPVAPTPTAQSTPDISPYIEEIIRNIVNSEVKPAIETIHAHCVDAIKTCTERILGEVWEKLSPTMKVTEDLLRLIDRSKLS